MHYALAFFSIVSWQYWIIFHFNCVPIGKVGFWTSLVLMTYMIMGSLFMSIVLSGITLFLYLTIIDHCSSSIPPFVVTIFLAHIFPVTYRNKVTIDPSLFICPCCFYSPFFFSFLSDVLMWFRTSVGYAISKWILLHVFWVLISREHYKFSLVLYLTIFQIQCSIITDMSCMLIIAFLAFFSVEARQFIDYCLAI